MKHNVICILALILAISAPAANAAELPEVKPSAVGMSAKTLAKVDTAVNALVAKKRLAGAIVIVARHGKIVLRKSYGQMDIAAKKPMRDDAIMRIYSMSKAITSVAALMLCEEGELDLNAPVSKYIPAFKGLKVFRKAGNIKPKREMIVRDLLRHTSGLTYGFFGNSAADAMYRKAKVMDRNSGLDVMCMKLGKIPLAYEPGKDWRYSVSVDVLGRVIEVVSKKSLDKFFAERIFKPLDMKDTGFFVPDSKLDRFAVNYATNGRGTLTPKDAPATSRYRKSPAHLSGGGGLVSTARDYMRFTVMLTNGGRLGDTRLLKADTVKLMTTNQLPEGIGWIRLGYHRVGTGFGLGLSVRVKSSNIEKASKVGECGWGGAASTHFWISPADGLAVVTLEQTMPYSLLVERDIKGIIYDAIEK
jgi:CubicO group peptidase (beta-lactamase class C family)